MTPRPQDRRSTVERGVEFYAQRDRLGRLHDGCQCARCGSSAEFIRCYECALED